MEPDLQTCKEYLCCQPQVLKSPADSCSPKVTFRTPPHHHQRKKKKRQKPFAFMSGLSFFWILILLCSLKSHIQIALWLQDWEYFPPLFLHYLNMKAELHHHQIPGALTLKMTLMTQDSVKSGQLATVLENMKSCFVGSCKETPVFIFFFPPSDTLFLQQNISNIQEFIRE